jgi:hypothetical protein
MVTIAEVDLQLKQISGRYIVMKLTGEKQEPKAPSRNALSGKLEIIEEASSEQK